MTPEALVAQLRDIHVPPAPDALAWSTFAWWPLILLALVIVGIAIMHFWQRNHWRRRAKAELSAILASGDAVEQWPKLLAFARRLAELRGRTVELPNIAFRRPQTLNDDNRAEFVSFLKAELRK